jgi:hypothetical protein
MGGSRGQRYMFTGPEEVALLYTERHVMRSRVSVRRAHLARMGGAAKPEAAAASPRLLLKLLLFIYLYKLRYIYYIFN